MQRCKKCNKLLYFRKEAGKAYVDAASKHGRAVAELEIARLEFERVSVQLKRDWITAAKSIEKQEEAEEVLKEKKSELERAERELAEKKKACNKFNASTDSSDNESK